MRLANFTLHDQSAYASQWKVLGFEIDPEPRAPLIEFEKGDWTEETILEAVAGELGHIKANGFDAILIDGLSNAMAYAWLLAHEFGLTAIIARTLRKRTEDGKLIFKLTGYSQLIRPEVVRTYPNARIIAHAMKDVREHLYAGDALSAIDRLIVAVEALEEQVMG